MSTAVRTSRIGRKPISVPKGVDIKIQGDQIAVKGPKGLVTLKIHPYVKVSLSDGVIQVAPDTEQRKNLTGKKIKLFKSITGTIRANINNGIIGVSEGYERNMSLVGVGYRAQAKGKSVGLSLGFSHPTNYDLSEGVTAETPEQTKIVLKGADKVKVGQDAAKIRAKRPPEPYKGKGVRYLNENVEIKETKKK